MTADLEQRARRYAALGEPVRLAIVDRLALTDAAPGDLGRALGIPTNLLAHHLRVLEDAALIQRARSEGDGRRSYVRLRLADPLVPGLGPGETHIAAQPGSAAIEVASARRVVFVCTHNSARSQLAAAVWKRLSATPTASAGTHPAGGVHPRTVAVGRRHGLRLSGAATARTDDVLDDNDLVVAVCDNAHEELADYSGARTRLHWSVPDPVRADTEDAFEAAYAEIASRVGRLASAMTPAPPRRTRPRRGRTRPAQRVDH